MRCWIDGVEAPEPALTVADGAVLRGDGCFEAIRSYSGVAFAVDAHVARLHRSAAALDLRPPDGVADWVRTAAAAGGDGIVRVVVTRGSDVPGRSDPSRCLILHHPVPESPPEVRLFPVPAPWHPAGRPWALAGAKTISYAPNMSARREALAAGFDDALLVADNGTLLEGPTFSVAWVCDGVVETPGLDLHVLDSITRRVVLELAAGLGITTVEGRFGPDRLEAADEVLCLSTVKEVAPVVAVGARTWPVGPVTASLREAFDARVAQETSEQGGEVT
ncbi:MAG: aminotransferase class IV [Acidimicrobiia bacterium]|jgi:4-amino-4-deoxychorismate lyase